MDDEIANRTFDFGMITGHARLEFDPGPVVSNHVRRSANCHCPTTSPTLSYVVFPLPKDERCPNVSTTRIFCDFNGQSKGCLPRGGGGEDRYLIKVFPKRGRESMDRGIERSRSLVRRNKARLRCYLGACEPNPKEIFEGSNFRRYIVVRSRPRIVYNVDPCSMIR